jgi:hypothetical protein
MSQAASYGRSFLLQSPARFIPGGASQDATSSEYVRRKECAGTSAAIGKCHLAESLETGAATLTRCFVHPMFTHDVRREASLHVRSAFARARVKNARICPLPGPLERPPAHENRMET